MLLYQSQDLSPISEPPSRIVSLVPSITELLHDLQLSTEVVGITKFCIYPDEWFRNKKRVGGTKNVNLEAVTDLAPELIIANKEENVREQIEALGAMFPVYISDVNNYKEALVMIREVGNITSRDQSAVQIVENIEQEFKNLASQRRIKALYLIWKDPFMTIGGDTFIQSMMEKAGFENVYSSQARYPTVTEEDIRTSGAEVVLLSSEPYPFKEKHLKEIETLLPDANVVLVDGEMFSWYGSRMQDAPAYFQQLRQFA